MNLGHAAEKSNTLNYLFLISQNIFSMSTRQGKAGWVLRLLAGKSFRHGLA